MNERVCSGRLSAVSRIALVSLIGGLASACSSDTMRLSQPFTNPFSSSQRVAASEPQRSAPDPATSRIAAVPTAPVQSQALPPVAASAPRMPSAPVTSSQGGWSAAGGTRVTVGANDSLDTLSQRYGVPSSAILTANGLSSSNQVAAGRDIVIPVFNAAGRPTQVAASSQPKLRLVEGPKPVAQTVTAKADEPKQRVRPGQVATAQKDRVPGQQVASAAPVAAFPKATAAQPAQPVLSQPAKPVAPGSSPVVTGKLSAPASPAAAPQPPVAAPAASPQEPEQTGALGTDFRWPARGRVIAGFGANGGNEGINIALPEGTPVKATEAGTVTYAGSEVKGYGHLVLIRHDNGYVSAYAHNGSLNVKRGERVKRGQVIATSGQTGNVTSPQLHFELRKGQAPVDPMPHLNGT